MNNIEKMKLVLLLYAVLSSIASCATAKKVMAPSGNLGYSVECNGTAVSMTSCYEKAAEVCPSGYIIVNQQNRTGFVANPYYVGATSNKGIFIECK